MRFQFPTEILKTAVHCSQCSRKLIPDRRTVDAEGSTSVIGRPDGWRGQRHRVCRSKMASTQNTRCRHNVVGQVRRCHAVEALEDEHNNFEVNPLTDG